MNNLIADFRQQLAECKRVSSVERLLYETWQLIPITDAETNTLVGKLANERKHELIKMKDAI